MRKFYYIENKINAFDLKMSSHDELTFQRSFLTLLSQQFAVAYFLNYFKHYIEATYKENTVGLWSILQEYHDWYKQKKENICVESPELSIIPSEVFIQESN